MVRLKVIAEKVTQRMIEFQFLMVRLKGFTIPNRHFIACRISIPYGSIKSALSSFARKSFIISIPYGSIKSLDQAAECDGLSDFNSLWFD